MSRFISFSARIPGTTRHLSRCQKFRVEPDSESFNDFDEVLVRLEQFLKTRQTKMMLMKKKMKKKKKKEKQRKKKKKKKKEEEKEEKKKKKKKKRKTKKRKKKKVVV
ncbi:hypothetical protein M8J75_008997 [Diaphorina citri]|nr:hypothetical protein M8J75_008997 [Diaphorina citri]